MVPENNTSSQLRTVLLSRQQFMETFDALTPEMRRVYADAPLNFDPRQATHFVDAEALRKRGWQVMKDSANKMFCTDYTGFVGRFYPMR